MTMASEIPVERPERYEGAIAIVTINRPHRRNALNENAWRDLGDAFAVLNADRSVRAIVLTGAGGAFCAGDDIAAFGAVRDKPQERQRYWDHIMACYAAIGAARIPVAAAVSGPCVGGGCTLALRADFRIADSTAYFGVPPAKLGLVYPMDSTQLLVATAGVGMAKRMLFTGDMIKAPEARACGLVTELVESDALAAAIAFVEPMTRGAPISIEAGKIACNAIIMGKVDQYAAQVAELLRLGDASDDYREGVAAFAEKRPPKFTGR